MTFQGYSEVIPDPGSSGRRANLGAAWVPKKHLSIFSQSKEAINSVLSTKDD